MRPAKIVYSISNIPSTLSQPLFGRIETSGERCREDENRRGVRDDLVPAAGNREVKQAERDQRAADHDRSLNEICPDDGFDSTKRGVDRGQNRRSQPSRRYKSRASAIGLGRTPLNHFIGEGEGDGRDVQARTGGEQARDHENGGSSVLGRDAEARGQVFVDRDRLCSRNRA